MADARQLARIHRVRTLQLTLARAEEARAHEAVATERQLADRIAQLAGAVGPASGGGFALVAAAHFRERLHQSAASAEQRVTAAEQRALAAAEATQGAKRDQGAVEKLQERAVADLLRLEMRALEDLAGATRKRHGSC
jgi:flagellar protein FliJ